MFRVTIHQPMYFPYPGVFDKIKTSDHFIFLDDAVYSNNYFFNRNKIKTQNGPLMLTVPVLNSFGNKLNDINIDNHSSWQKKHYKSITLNYSKSNNFKDHVDYFKNIYTKQWGKLNALNIETMLYIMDQLEIDTPISFSSELMANKDLTSTERIVYLCKKMGAETYLSGISGKDYLDIDLFKKKEIKVEFQNYQPKEYNQLHGNFIPNLSILDLLFNTGHDAKYYI